ncbi:ATP-NAD kinase family protein [Bradyrhizobium sp. CCBAU 21360]|uniref:ATP-NAD kinase family protein n=1 Tax=Bradyrhizobium sp. CCBAU 21360 TaxID=1325081 RepID=UPI0023056937|nr:NAD(+)/NADH kinase [Bradyrhizobium sp. CCBAU 21360]MDA9448344.1 acetoin catabolism protein X [Bradyrhizobium sp. CCBAU 21360]
MSSPVVGIIANPVSARDIRRVISHAGSLQITDRANIVLRILAGLAASGVDKVVMMPENAGIRGHLARALNRAANVGRARFPDLSFLDMHITGTAMDSVNAARRMRQMDVAAIVVLGGDGTHRVVIASCGNTPVAGVSTGTNNAFPEMREPTVTGLAVGLAVTGRVPPSTVFVGNKRLDVRINDREEIALVDVAVVNERYVGSRAVWRTDSFRELFVTFGEPGGIGMSSIVGLLAPVKRKAPFGRRVVFAPPETASFTLPAPIAPGLIEPVGIESVETIDLNTPIKLKIGAGSIAFDGERELTFSETDEVYITLRDAAFRTIDVEACMSAAAASGLFVQSADRVSGVNHVQGG